MELRHIPREVGDIVGQQRGNSVAAHRSHDIGVVDLFPLDISRFHKVEQQGSDGGILIGDFEFSFELADGLRECLKRRRRARRRRAA